METIDSPNFMAIQGFDKMTKSIDKAIKLPKCHPICFIPKIDIKELKHGIDHILLMKCSQTNPNPRDQQDLLQMEGSSCDDHDHHLILFNNRSSSEEDDDHSRNSNDSSSDLMEDASSSSSSSISNGPLYELSELMSHLPIKRGLSKYYEGKSQSFTSLARVKSKEELVKKENPYNQKSSYKKSKSYNHKNKYSYSPKAIITKKVSRGVALLSSSMMSNRSTLLASFRPPIPIQKCSHLASNGMVL